MLLSGVTEKKLSEHVRLIYFNVIEYEDFAKLLMTAWFLFGSVRKGIGL